MKAFDPSSIRKQFPALNQTVNGSTPVFLDGPGGTQLHQSVIDAVTGYLTRGVSNIMNSPFFAVEETFKTMNAARERAAAFVNASSSDEIVFGANMSTVTAHLSRSIAREWKEGDEIIVTDLDHEANISFWKMAAADRGAVVKTVPLMKDDLTPDYAALEKLISKKTKFVAFGLASNVCGTRSDPARFMKAAKSVGALTFVDSVHAAPHFLPDVQVLGCDFLVCSGYKFFGPHMGLLYGKREHLERLTPYKVEPAGDAIPRRWETGTANFEILSGFSACIDYLASLGEGSDLRARLKSSYERVAIYEQAWTKEFLRKAKDIKGMRVYGITDPARAHERTATFAFTIDGRTPQEVSHHLAKNNISAGSSNFYGIGVTKTIGLPEIVRAGCVHYNTVGEMERLFEALGRLK